MSEIMITGRLVQGHPMVLNPDMDDVSKLQKKDRNGNDRFNCFMAVAVAKGAETDWKQTEWGSQVYQAAVTGWSNGEYQRLDFAWKIIDGDSAIPDKKGRKPCEREGWPGHWIVKLRNGFAVDSYHPGRYQPHEMIKDVKAIKTGDYCRVIFTAVGNAPSQSPGVYLNPSLFELSRAGIEIISENRPDAAAAFGGSVAQLPPNAQIDTTVAPAATPAPGTAGPAPAVPGQAAPVPAVTPDPNFAQAAPAPAPAVESFVLNGVKWTREQLKASNWTDEAINALPRG